MALFDPYGGGFSTPFLGEDDLGGGSPSFSSAAQPPPRRLTYEEILAHLQKPAAPNAPTPYGGFGDLPADQQKSGKLDALWAGLAALSGGVTSGRWGQAATEGTQAIQGIQSNAVRQANAQQEAVYQAQLTNTAQKAQQERTKQQAAALAGMYNRATANEDPMSPFAQQAADAAQRGDMSALEKMASPETQSQRASAKARGLNPDAWDSIEQLKATLKDNIAKQSLEALSGPEAAAAALKAKATQDAVMPGEKALKLAPSYQAPPQYEPLSRIAARTELVQGIEDKHAQLREAAKQGTSIPGRLAEMPDKTWAWISPPTAANPKPTMTPVDGQPVKSGGLSHFMKDGQPYVWNPGKAEMGAIPVAVHEAGEAGAPSIKDLTAAPPRVPSPGQGGQGPPGRPAPVAAPEASKKLGAVADPAVQKRIGAARAAGYSDSEIASFLGIH